MSSEENTQQHYEMIEDYLAGGLSEADQKAFEARLETDPALKAEVQLHREIASAVSDPELEAFHATLDEIDAAVTQAPEQESVSRNKGVFSLRTRQFLMAAAALAGIWLLSTVVLQLSGPNYSGMIMAEIRQLDDFSPTRGSSDESEQLMNAGMESYRDGDFTKAHQSFSLAGQLQPTDMSIAFWTGLAAYQDTVPATDALIHFLAVAADGKSIWTEQSVLLSTMIYMDRGENDAARTILASLEPADWTLRGNKIRKKLLRQLEKSDT